MCVRVCHVPLTDDDPQANIGWQAHLSTRSSASYLSQCHKKQTQRSQERTKLGREPLSKLTIRLPAYNVTGEIDKQRAFLKKKKKKMRYIILILLQFSLSALTLSQNQNFYDADPHIIELTARNFDKVVYGTNHSTLVEFYAPWCGYCKQLKPKYHKVAKRLDGIVQIASVNCDLAKNRQLCSEQGIQGFPTVKIFKPPSGHNGKKSNKFDGVLYQGAREVKAIADFTLGFVRNSVTKLEKKPAVLRKLLHREKYLGILLSRKDTISPLYKSIALNWMGKVKFAMVPLDKIDPESFFGSAVFKGDKYSDLLNLLRTTIEELKRNGAKSNKFIVLDIERGAIEPLETKPSSGIKGAVISEFLSKITGEIPNEGPLSKRQDYIDGLKRGQHKKEGKSKTGSSRRDRDEL